jgi:hypothetical protein
MSRRHLTEGGFKRDYGVEENAADQQTAYSTWTAGRLYARGLEEALGHVESRRAGFRHNVCPHVGEIQVTRKNYTRHQVSSRRSGTIKVKMTPQDSPRNSLSDLISYMLSQTLCASQSWQSSLSSSTPYCSVSIGGRDSILMGLRFCCTGLS